MSNQTEIDFDAYYTVKGWSEGTAFYLLGPVMNRDEDYWWTGIEEPDENMVRAVMVGDDKVYRVYRDDLVLLDEEEFCHGCGQVGCGH